MSGDFVKVASQKDIPAGAMKAVEYGEESVCLANIDGKYYAMGNICTHEGGPLAEGSLDNYEVECPWHGARFDVRTGKVLSSPATESVSSYEVMIKDGDILIRKIG